MVRIAFLKMLILVRLAMVASLALYTLPNAAFAMHGAEASAVAVSDHHADHASMSTSDHQDQGVFRNIAKHDQKQDKQACCSDFCISLAIMAEVPADGPRSNDSVLHFMNDAFVHGQLSNLHRPPSIRA